MENNNASTVEKSSTKERSNKTVIGGVPAPTETINFCLEMVRTIVAGHGTATPVSKEDISKELKKAVPTLIMKISSCVQYRILINVHGKGYQASDLFQKYSQPVYPNDELIAKLKMFQSVPLYAKLIENINNEILPAEDNFVNLLRGEVYKLNPNSAERAAKIFFENSRSLNLIDSSGRFKFNADLEDKPKEEKEPPIKKQDEQIKEQLTINMIEVNIPMKNKEKAFLRFPEEYTNEDMDKIARIVQAYKDMVSE